MALPVLVLGACAVLAGIVWAAARERRRVEEAWRTLADSLRLPYFGVDQRHVSGHVGALKVEVADLVRGTGKEERHVTRVFVTGPLVGRGLRITNGGVLARVKAFLDGSRVTLGLPEFDRRVHVEGDEALAIAALTAPVREALLRLLDTAPAAEVTSDGCIVFEQHGTLRHPERVAELVRRMVDVALALDVASSELVPRLAEAARTEAEPEIRQRSLELLVRDHPDADETRRAAQTCLHDGAPAIRLLAARTVGGSAGFDILRALLDTAAGTELRLRALEALIAAHPYREVAPVLENLLKTGRPELRELAVRTIGHARDTSRLDRVLRMATHDVASLAEAAATVLGQIGDERAEPALLGFLQHADPSVRTSAARSLARVGTIAAVEPLLAHTTGLRTPAELKQAATDAIRRIQARLGPADSGRLTVVDDEGAGALSLAADSGELALVDDAGLPAAPRRRERE